MKFTEEEIIKIIEENILNFGGEIICEIEDEQLLAHFFERYFYPDGLNETLEDILEVEYGVISSNTSIKEIIELVNNI